MDNWALGIGHWALGIGHWALGIEKIPLVPLVPPFPMPHSPFPNSRLSPTIPLSLVTQEAYVMAASDGHR